jgi:hypothetical protein
MDDEELETAMAARSLAVRAGDAVRLHQACLSMSTPSAEFC